MNIEKELKTVANQICASLEEREIYRSRQFNEHMKALCGTVLGNYASTPKLLIEEIPPYTTESGITTAFTDGEQIVINSQCPIVTFFPNPERRFLAIKGLLFHELCHILYNPFERINEIHKFMKDSGELYGDMPVPNDPAEANALADLCVAFKGSFRELIISIYHQLENICADAHDEDCAIDEFGRLMAEPIMAIREFDRANISPLEEIEEAVASGRTSKLEAIYSLLLRYVYYGDVFYLNEDTYLNSTIAEFMNTITGFADIARSTDSLDERYLALNNIVIRLWTVVQEEMKNMNQDANGGSKSGDGDNSPPSEEQGNNSQSSESGTAAPSPEIQQAVKDMLQNAAATMVFAPMPKNVKASGKANEAGKSDSQDRNNSQGRVVDFDNLPEPEDDGEYDQICRDVAMERAEKALEAEQKKEIEQNACEILKESECHRGILGKIDRVLDIDEEDTDNYNDIMKELALYSKTLRKQVQELLKGSRAGHINKHRAYGRIIRPQDAYRPDQRFFANRKAPEDALNMAISVLVDLSGSMSGERIAAAKRAAILLDDFAAGLHIPVSVAGHRINRGFEYFVYTDFDRISKKDKYRLAKMSAGGCNRDGAALEISARRLKERTEQMRLLIIISDGQPNDTDYSGKAAEEDIRNIVSKYRREGVEIIAAAIGDDKETISRIYGDGFLDITDLSKLPGTLVNLVRQRMKLK